MLKSNALDHPSDSSLTSLQWFLSIYSGIFPSEQLSNHPGAVLLDARIYSINIEPECWQTNPES